jgi:hypothetical protein
MGQKRAAENTDTLCSSPGINVKNGQEAMPLVSRVLPQPRKGGFSQACDRGPFHSSRL